MPIDLEARARERILEAVHAGKFTRRALGKLIGYGDTGIGLILMGKRSLPLTVLQAAAELAQVDPAEWIADPRALVKVLTPTEAELLRYARDWPAPTRLALLNFLQHFQGESTLEEEFRKAVTYLRAMSKTQRDLAMAALLLRSEGELPADIRAKLAADPVPTPPGGSIDALLVGVAAEHVAFVRAAAEKARAASRRKTRSGG
jgi:hypothetical protein